MDSEQNCPSCKAPILETQYFCAQCGHQIKQKPLSITIARQIMMYVISIILPPFGLGWAVKYVRNENKTAQKIGITIIVLTILSLIANFYALYALYDSYASLLNPYSNLNF